MKETEMGWSLKVSLVAALCIILLSYTKNGPVDMPFAGTGSEDYVGEVINECLHT